MYSRHKVNMTTRLKRTVVKAIISTMPPAEKDTVAREIEDELAACNYDNGVGYEGSLEQLAKELSK